MKISIIKELTDEQLVQAFQTSVDKEVFGEIYNRYYKNVFHICVGYTKNRDTAFDLVQDIMIKVLAQLPSLKHANLLGYWIARIAKNYSLDYCKKQNRSRTDSMDAQFDIVEETSDMPALEAKEILLNNMEQLMEELGEETTTFLRLKYLEGYTIKDLQAKFNLKSGAVKMRLQRGRQQVLAVYQAQFGQVYQ